MRGTSDRLNWTLRWQLTSIDIYTSSSIQSVGRAYFSNIYGLSWSSYFVRKICLFNYLAFYAGSIVAVDIKFKKTFLPMFSVPSAIWISTVIIGFQPEHSLAIEISDGWYSLPNHCRTSLYCCDHKHWFVLSLNFVIQSAKEVLQVFSADYFFHFLVEYFFAATLKP